jgi:hypothetical protein
MTTMSLQMLCSAKSAQIDERGQSKVLTYAEEPIRREAQ